MRRIEFAWLLPVCMVLTLVAAGSVIALSLDWLQNPQKEAPLNEELGCGVVYPESFAANSIDVVATMDTSAADYRSIAAGDALFKGNCAQCHAINDIVVGPALGGITERRPMSWIIPWVKNSTRMVANGDEYAVKIFDRYQKQQMPSFELSADEIRNIVAYIEAQDQAIRANSPTGLVVVYD